jgi:hypothetical protein
VQLSSTIAGIRLPDTRLCREAFDLAAEHERPEVLLHSVRSFVFASLIGQFRKVSFDEELLFVAGVLHDIGLAPAFETFDNRFEVDSANVARELMKRHPRTREDQEVVWDAIALHSSGAIAKWKRPEIALINAGVVTDVHGVYLAGLQPADVRDVLDHAPRTNFVDGFLEDLVRIATSKPQATQNTFVADVGIRLVPGFHLLNFVDELRNIDPFVDYSSPS